MTNPDIAAELYISAQTIKSHSNRIFAKTGSANPIAAIRYARDRHLGWSPPAGTSRALLFRCGPP
jgi:DNA-binding NarL/FixJ family response regulator